MPSFEPAQATVLADVMPSFAASTQAAAMSAFAAALAAAKAAAKAAAMSKFAASLAAAAKVAAATGLGMWAAGFTYTGIKLGSIASGIQSFIGCVKAGSAFAYLQSMGASGIFEVLGVYGAIATCISCAFKKG